MNCAYHSNNLAGVSCNGCGRPLCAACDHRIKGFAYCEDCIVAGVQEMRHSRRSGHGAASGRRTYPLIALLLSWVCPGLGAAYNGQMIKALVHFGIVAGLFQMAVSTGMAMFLLGLLGMWWFFLPLDAWRSAKFIRSGAGSNDAGNLILERLEENSKVAAVLLIGIGCVSLIYWSFGSNALVRGVLPILLILLGVYLVKDVAFARNRDRNRTADATDWVPDPASFRESVKQNGENRGKSSWRN